MPRINSSIALGGMLIGLYFIFGQREPLKSLKRGHDRIRFVNEIYHFIRTVEDKLSKRGKSLVKKN